MPRPSAAGALGAPLRIGLLVFLSIAGAATVHAASVPVLPFRAVTYDEALADAKARELPLFVESWAPW